MASPIGVKISQLHQRKQSDQSFETMLSLLEKQRSLFHKVGNMILSMNTEEMQILFKNWLEIIQLFGNDFSYANGTLSFLQGDDLQRKQMKQKMLDLLNEPIDRLKNQLSVLEGKIPSSQMNDIKNDLTEKLKSYHRLQAEILTTFSEIETIKAEEKKLFEENLGKR